MLLDQRDRRHAAVIVPDHVGDAGLLDRLDHRLAFGLGAGQRLFAEHHLAGLGGGDGDLGVEVVGHADVDGVDILALDQRAPVGLDALIAPLLGEVPDLARRCAPRRP